MGSKHLSVTVSAFAVLSFAPQIGLADTATPDTGNRPLPEIIVTAQKRSEVETKVPISMMAIDQETLTKQGVTDISDIARLVPGLNFQASDDAGDTSISIRGISSDVGAATTGIYIDDSPVQARPDAVGTHPYPKIFDLDRVEVLRGPQGTLFGSGSEGGTVRFITPEPSLTDYSGSVRTEFADTYGADPSFQTTAAVGGPIIDGKIGFRASASYRDDGGYIDRVSPVTGQQTASDTNKTGSEVARLAFRIAPTDQFFITPAVFYQDTRADDLSLYWEASGRFNESTKIPQPTNDHFVLPSLTLEYDFDAFSVKTISSYLQRAVNSVYDSTAYQLSTLLPYGVVLPTDPNYLSAAHYYSSQQNYSQELRFTSNDSPGSPWSWVGGLFYSHARSASNSSYDDPKFGEVSAYLYYQCIAGGDTPSDCGAPTTVGYFGEPLIGGVASYVDHFVENETDMAAYGNASYEVIDNLKISAGIRVARSGFTYFDASDGPWGAAEYLAYSGSEKETPVTPRFNITYQIDPNEMIYATVAKGYRIGGANEPVPVNPAVPDSCYGDLQKLGLKQAPQTFNSDSVWSYEAGVKGHIFDNTVLVEASIYWVDWTNIQESVYLPTCSYYYVGNLGQAASRGFDVQAEWSVSKELVLSGTAGLVDARYTKDSLENGVLLAKTGDTLGTPEWTATLAAEYTTQVLDDTEGYGRIDYEFQGGYYRYGSAEVYGYDPALKNGAATHYVNARAGIRREGWDIAIFGENLLNSDTSLFRFRDTPSTYAFRDTTFRPLTFGVSAEYKF
jgi:outer membrane receptor protein involved in Fe transport